jgi:hypothetical protein
MKIIIENILFNKLFKKLHLSYFFKLSHPFWDTVYLSIINICTVVQYIMSEYLIILNACSTRISFQTFLLLIHCRLSPQGGVTLQKCTQKIILQYALSNTATLFYNFLSFLNSAPGSHSQFTYGHMPICNMAFAHTTSVAKSILKSRPSYFKNKKTTCWDLGSLINNFLKYFGRTLFTTESCSFLMLRLVL